MQKSYKTLKEILDQPESWEDVINRVKENRDEIRDFFSRHENNQVLFIGCGSSYYLSLAASRIFSHFTGRPAKALPASELLLYPEVYLKSGQKYLFIPISRSGESTETVRALAEAKRAYHVDSFAVTCYEDSSLVKDSHAWIATPEGKEESVVMTKSFTSMLLSLQLIIALAVEAKDYYDELQRLPELGRAVMEKYGDLAKGLAYGSQYHNLIYLGSGPYYGLACEAMLKMREMANLSCEAYHTLEYMHGPKAGADDKTLVCLLWSEIRDDYGEKFLKGLKDLGTVNLIECEVSQGYMRSIDQYLWEIKSGISDLARINLYLLPFHLFAFHYTVRLGLNPDSPRNLSQVVSY